MDKKKLAQAVKRMEYCYKKGMLGARGFYKSGGEYCVIGCLFTDDAILQLHRANLNGEDIFVLFNTYPKLESALGDNMAELTVAQKYNDDCGPLEAIKYLKEVIKNAN